jgi:hypothetical protein
MKIIGKTSGGLMLEPISTVVESLIEKGDRP